MPSKSRPVPTVPSTTEFRHVLIPCDLTDRAGQALAMTRRLALPETTRVTMLHLIATLDGVRTAELRPFYARLDRKARAGMTALVRRAAKAGSGCADVDIAVRYGPAAEGIVEFAAENDVDLIVLASHPVDPSMTGRDWGTVSYKVGILARCPVLLVK